jgi:pimeloyl-ACP methyl ester carboxylesterase
MPHVVLQKVALPQAVVEYRVIGPDDSAHPPVLFVHGILVDHRLWVGVAERLAQQGFRCILPNLPLGSHTIAVEQRSALSPAGVAELINDFLVALELDDVTLVGNDTGGGLCQLLVDAHPERIGRLVLTNCDAFDKFPPFPFNAVFALLRGPKSIRTLMSMMAPTAVRHSPLGFGLLSTNLDPDVTASWIAPCGSDSRIAGDLAALLRQVAVTDLTDVATRLPRFTKPVTLVWGMGDRCFTPGLGRKLAARFPAASFVEVPGARTFVALDAPAAVADAIKGIAAVGANS